MTSFLSRHQKLAKITAVASTIASIGLGTPRLVFAQADGNLNILPPTNLLPQVGPGQVLQGVIRLILIAAFVIAFIILFS